MKFWALHATGFGLKYLVLITCFAANSMPEHDLIFEHVDDSPPIKSLIGSSELMKRVFQMTRLYAKSAASVLILGETGTGKELIAEALHDLSERKDQPFVKLNCGALSEALLELSLIHI